MEENGRFPPDEGESYMRLTDSQRDAIQSVERLGASLSLVFSLLVFVTFGLFKRLRTLPNTFMLFASVANVGASTACLIGYASIEQESAPLCQAQAFLLEMFMQADPWWSLAMAFNVFMVFFHSANPTSFRDWLWLYCLVCFGLPAVPSVVLLVISLNQIQDGQRPLYGDATLWCWIADSRKSMRIFTYYLPVWVCILLSGLVYVAVGYHVFQQRNQLRNLTLSNPIKDTSGDEMRRSAEKAHAAHVQSTGQPYGTVTTEVQVTSAASGPSTRPPTPLPPIGRMSTRQCADDCPRPKNVTTTPTTAQPLAFPTSTVTVRRGSDTGNPAGSGMLGRLAATLRNRWGRLSRLDPVKLAYLRTSFVFAVSVLVTWTPSSINRVYTLAKPDALSFPLNLASAVVLPLQGVWTGAIYAVMSWATLREELADLAVRFGWFSPPRAWMRRGSERLGSVPGPVGGPAHRGGGGGTTRAGSPGEAYSWEEGRDFEMTPRRNVRVFRGASFSA